MTLDGEIAALHAIANRKNRDRTPSFWSGCLTETSSPSTSGTLEGNCRRGRYARSTKSPAPPTALPPSPIGKERFMGTPTPSLPSA